MVTVVLLSSSPPRAFARSPTPAATSSPGLVSPSSMFNAPGSAHKRFKTTFCQRDGFSRGFESARSVLSVKAGSENLPFKVVKQNLQKESSGPSQRPHPKFKPLNASQGRSDETKDAVLTRPPNDESVLGGRFEIQLGHIDEPSPHPARSTLISNRTKSQEQFTKGQEPVHQRSQPSFPGGPLTSFGHDGGSAPTSPTSKHGEEGGPTKRRRLDIVDTGSQKPVTTLEALKFVPTIKSQIAAPTKRSKSPKKKYTTITSIATSHYLGEDDKVVTPTPLQQFLSTTQAKDIGDPDEPAPDTAKRKRPSKKSTARKKSLPKSILLSPESAMKALDSQETLFGSCSQLARDESPSLVRDTLEALKQSESSFSSTPVPTQITVPSEPGSVTRATRGSARFARSRNLWANAARDEDNALLQIETIDLIDSPDLRLAFAGKDAMLQAGAQRHYHSQSPEKTTPSLRGGHLPMSARNTRCQLVDIDDLSFITPYAKSISMPTLQARGLQTVAKPPDGAAAEPDHPSGKIGDTQEEHPSGRQDAEGTSLQKPPRPSFGGYSDTELAKQIKEYGFKPMKKREKMIEILERCWDEKHKSIATDQNKTVPEQPQDEEDDSMTHGDFLSKVHGLASRPTPKITKPKRQKKDKTATPAKPKKVAKPKSPAKVSATGLSEKTVTPRKRRKAEPKPKKPNESATEKAPRKRKPKAPVLSSEYVIDTSDIDDPVIQKAGRTAKPSGSKTVSDKAKEVVASATRLATPPPTLPTYSVEVSSNTPKPTASSTPDLPDIQKQITRAITSYVPAPDRDHRRNPTWHEKILLYDPIVLEDLAAWLNTEGLGLINEDREVSALEVRSWCESHGCCCLGLGGGWRGTNGKGKGKTRDGEMED